MIADISILNELMLILLLLLLLLFRCRLFAFASDIVPMMSYHQSSFLCHHNHNFLL